jgi:diphosphomevalonate decarboxylase
MRERATPIGAAFLCAASPSLALLKYWGKARGGYNLPATPSLALSLGALKTRTLVEASPARADEAGADFLDLDEVSVNGARQPRERYALFFEALRRELRASLRFRVWSRNDFPGSSGLASSSSGFAALACAAVRAGEAVLGRVGGLPPTGISRLARIGSVSAARAVFGGFSLLPARARTARALYPERHWPELRVLVALVSREEKPVSSRAAMELGRSSSAFHSSWLRAARSELPGALEALAGRDLESLGLAMRRSYLRMFGSMLACDSPLLYWLPGSLSILRECESLRREGVGVWETMDAGPQVKLLCLAPDLPRVTERIRATGAALALIDSLVGGAPEIAAVQGTNRGCPIEQDSASAILDAFEGTAMAAAAPEDHRELRSLQP